MIDSHVHADQLKDPLSAIERALQSGVTGALWVSMDPASWHANQVQRQRVAQAIPSWTTWMAYGIHPELGVPQTEDLFDHWSWQLQKGYLHAVGEIGLPYYHSVSAHEWAVRVDLTLRQLRLAAKWELPVVIHAVHDATWPMLDLLQRTPSLPSIVFHWLKAPPSAIQEIIRRGYYVGITPEVLWRNRDQTLLSLIPMDQILWETDAPWPHDLAHKRPSEPADLLEMANSPICMPGPDKVRENFLRFIRAFG